MLVRELIYDINADLSASCKNLFISISLADILRGEVGGAEARLREVFAQAKEGAPAIIFIDEIQVKKLII